MDRSRIGGVLLGALLAGLPALGGCGRPATPPASAPRAADDALRALGEGAVRGFVDAAGGHTWLGIPFAVPPVGERRWTAPIPAPSPPGLHDALVPGAPCIQYGWALTGLGTNGSHEGREDCLYLNVHAPRMSAEAAATAKLPVMVWVHGGANTVGQGASYDGSALARSGHVIVVTFNYRLGPFGWFILPRGRDATAPATDPVVASGNFGILDEIAALGWVHEHIAAFGGDPGNVTVFGESAGGTNALALLVAPSARHLYQRVIIQSLGFGLAAPERASHYVDDAVAGGEYSSAEILLKALVKAGRAHDREAAKAVAAGMSEAEIATFLRGLDPWAFYALYHPSNIETDLFPTVFQDGTVVQAGDLESLLRARAEQDGPAVILGTNRDEPKLFMAFDPRLVATIGGTPVWIRDRAAYEREADYRATLWRANAVDRPARALAAGGSAVFTYRFDWRGEGRRFGVLDLGRLVGAAHGLEIPFVFGTFDSTPGHDLLFSAESRAGREALSAQMMSYWAEFAAHGRPGRGRDGTLPEWAAWQDGDPGSMLFEQPSPAGPVRAAVPASREGVVERMEQQEPPGDAACRMFRATFRTRVDPWADAAWQRYRGGACAAGGSMRLGP